MRNLLICFVLLIASLTFPVTAQDSAFTERHLTIELDGSFTTDAILTLPTSGETSFPTVILFHGSGPYDMDATSMAAPGETTPRSANFKWMAETLPQQGIAVLRFNKRGVLGNGEYDFAQIRASTLDQLILDANSVIAAALEQPEVDAEALYLYGWSEGAWVVSNAAQTHPDLAGLILQGAPDESLASILSYQHLELGLPYMTDITDADGDGQLSLTEIATLPQSSVGLMASFYLYAQDSTVENPKLNPYTNTNGDDSIDIETELRPIVEMFMGNYASYLPQVEASYQTGELISASNISTLLLQGEHDGWVPLRSAQAIQTTAPEQVTLITYPGLGHALSLTENPAEDVFGVMDDQPIQDISAWILGKNN